MISAADARELAGVEVVPTFMEKASKAVYDAAKNGKRSTIIRGGPVIDHGYPTPKGRYWKEAAAKLEKLGYKVSYHYEENQFVDTGMKIEW